MGSYTASQYIRREDGNMPDLPLIPTPDDALYATRHPLILVSTAIPYQFAYMVACIVQLATCVWRNGMRKPGPPRT